jgi:hypothetical protein
MPTLLTSWKDIFLFREMMSTNSFARIFSQKKIKRNFSATICFSSLLQERNAK